MPDVVVFCNLLRKYRAASSMEDAADGEQETSLTHNGRAFIFKQLLLLARYLDWADEAGRQMMLADLRGVLQDLSTDEDHIADTLRVLAMAHQGGADLVKCVPPLGCPRARFPPIPPLPWPWRSWALRALPGR